MSKGIDKSSNCSYMGSATGMAHKARTGKAGDFHGGTPPSGPKKEPTKVNGVPIIKQSGVSGKGSPAK